MHNALATLLSVCVEVTWSCTQLASTDTDNLTTIFYDRCTANVPDVRFISTVPPWNRHLLSDGLSPVEKLCLDTSDERGADNACEAMLS